MIKMQIVGLAPQRLRKSKCLKILGNRRPLKQPRITTNRCMLGYNLRNSCISWLFCYFGDILKKEFLKSM